MIGRIIGKLTVILEKIICMELNFLEKSYSKKFYIP